MPDINDTCAKCGKKYFFHGESNENKEKCPDLDTARWLDQWFIPKEEKKVEALYICDHAGEYEICTQCGNKKPRLLKDIEQYNFLFINPKNNYCNYKNIPVKAIPYKEDKVAEGIMSLSCKSLLVEFLSKRQKSPIHLGRCSALMPIISFGASPSQSAILYHKLKGFILDYLRLSCLSVSRSKIAHVADFDTFHGSQLLTLLSPPNS